MLPKMNIAIVITLAETHTLLYLRSEVLCFPWPIAAHAWFGEVTHFLEASRGSGFGISQPRRM
jgi:hypothetical protein